MNEISAELPQLAKDTVRIVPLGGLGHIGRNMTVFECNGRLLIVDCGVLFPDDAQPGVDLILPDFSYIADRLDQVDAIVLTHGHEDHIGAVPYLLKMRPDIPLVGSALTIALVEAKLTEHNIEPYTFVVSEGDEERLGEFTCEFIAVNHSIPDALAVYMRSAGGNILITGDFKMDQLPLDGRVTDLRAFARAGETGVDLFMVDSTNAEVPGFVSSEGEIGPVLDGVFASSSGQIVVASFSSHIHRVQQVLNAAEKTERKVCFVGRSMVRNMDIAAELGNLHVPAGVLVSLKEIMLLPPNQRVFMSTGSQGEPRAVLARIAAGTHSRIVVGENDTVIFASSLIPGNENSVYKLINGLTKLGARVVHQGNAKVHVSGHCAQGELLYAYNIVRPRNVMPIHGEVRHLVANGSLAVKTGISGENVLLCEDGSVVDLTAGKAKVVGQIPCEQIFVEGRSVGEIDETDLMERITLSQEGFIAIIAVVDMQLRKVISGPYVQVRGMAASDETFATILPDVSQALVQKLADGESDTYQMQQAMRRVLGRWVAKTLRRGPMIIPIVLEN